MLLAAYPYISSPWNQVAPGLISQPLWKQSQILDVRHYGLENSLTLAMEPLLVACAGGDTAK